MTDTDRLLSISRRVAKRRRVTGMDAQDAEQEALLAMLTALKANPKLSSSQLENVSLNHLRTLCAKANAGRERQDDEFQTELNAARDDGPTPLDLIISDETLARLPDLLTPAEFKVIRVTFWEGLTDQNAAKTLGYTLQGFRVTKSRALKKLRESLLIKSP